MVQHHPRRSRKIAQGRSSIRPLSNKSDFSSLMLQLVETAGARYENPPTIAPPCMQSNRTRQCLATHHIGLAQCLNQLNSSTAQQAWLGSDWLQCYCPRVVSKKVSMSQTANVVGALVGFDVLAVHGGLAIVLTSGRDRACDGWQACRERHGRCICSPSLPSSRAAAKSRNTVTSAHAVGLPILDDQ